MEKKTKKKISAIIVTIALGVSILAGCTESFEDQANRINDENAEKIENADKIEVGEIPIIMINSSGTDVYWESAKNATKYEVYVNGKFVSKISKTNCSVNLNNYDTVSVIPVNGKYQGKAIYSTPFIRTIDVFTNDTEASIKQRYANLRNTEEENVKIIFLNKNPGNITTFWVDRKIDDGSVNHSIVEMTKMGTNKYSYKYLFLGNSKYPSLLKTIRNRDDFSGLLKEKIDDGWVIKSKIFDGTTDVDKIFYNFQQIYVAKSKSLLVLEKDGKTEIAEVTYRIEQKVKNGVEERDKEDVYNSFISNSFNSVVREIDTQIYNSQSDLYKKIINNSSLGNESDYQK